MRLLFISSDKFPPFRVDVNVLFGKEMIHRGHTIDWVLQSDEECACAHEVKWRGGTVYVGRSNRSQGAWSRLVKQWYGLVNDLRTISIAKTKNYDAIQCKDKFFGALVGLLAAKITKTRFVYWLSFPIPEAMMYRVRERTARYPAANYMRSVLYKLILYKIVMPAADYIFVQSQKMKQDLIAEGVAADKMFPVPMGVEFDDLTSVYQGEYTDSAYNSRRVYYLGTLSRVRQLNYLIKAFKNVQELYPDARLIFVGDTEHKEDVDFLRDEASSLGIDDKVLFTGRLPMKEAWAEIMKAHVCISPFYPTQILLSTSPTKLIEYMALGRPVVATDHPEQNAVISESGAGLSVPYEVDAIAEAIVALFKDSALCREMGIRGRQYVEYRRSYSAIADMVENQYYNIINKD